MKHIKKNPGGENSETSASVTYVSLTKIRSKSWQTSSMLTFFVLLVLLSWLLGQGIQQLNKKTVYSKLFMIVLILPSHCLSDRAVQNSTDSHCLRERYTYTACSSESPGRNSIYTGSDSDLLKVLLFPLLCPSSFFPGLQYSTCKAFFWLWAISP